jgi:hypothetical protein
MQDDLISCEIQGRAYLLLVINWTPWRPLAPPPSDTVQPLPGTKVEASVAVKPA